MACLKVIYADQTEQIIPLSRREPVSIGQHASNKICLDNPDAPILFARILWNKKSRGFEVTAASLDDIIIAGEAVRTAMLKEGDSFTIFNVEIIFHKEDVTENNPQEAKSNKQEIETVSGEDKKSSRSSSKKEKEKNEEVEEPAESIRLTRSSEATEDASVGEWIKKARRPGERDAVRSPMVTALIFVALLLAVAAGGFYLMIGKQTAQFAYNEAKTNREEGKYAQAIQLYSKFLSDFSSHRLADQARIELSFSRIDRALSGAGSDVNKALQAVEDFVTQHRQRDDYRDWFPQLAIYSSRISIAAYRQAGRQHNPELLKTGDQAQQLFARFKATDGSDDGNGLEIDKAARIARAELLEFDVQEETIAKMDQALKQNNVSLVLKSYREAVTRYPQFAKRKEFISRIKKTLLSEQQSITSKLFTDQKQTSAAVQDKANPLFKKNILLVARNSSRFDIQSDGHVVWFLVDGMIYAVDRMLGQVRWKITMGEPVVFEPISVNAQFESWLIPTRAGTAISLLKQEDGMVLWELELQSRITSRPAMIGGMLYFLTENRQLHAVERETGKRIGQITFPRNITAPICSLGDNLLCVGQEDVFYFIDRQTLKCSEVRYYGHARKTITLQPQLIVNQLVVLENDHLQSGRMQTLRYRKDDWKVETLQSNRLAGFAADTPIVWGDRLFMKTDRAVISAWRLSDAPGKPLLSRITNAPIPFSPDIKIFMQPVEGDRLLIAGESLRELTLLTNAFEQRALPVELGRATQSIQMYGTNLCIAGESIQEQGRVLIHYDVDQGKSFWRLRLSSEPAVLIANQNSSSSVRCLDASGNLFDLSRSKNSTSITYSEPIERILDLSKSSGSRLRTGRLNIQDKNLVYSGREVRLLNASGQIERSARLSATTQVVAATPQFIFWANQTGIHITPWETQTSTASDWLSPVGKNETKFHRWTDLIMIDNQNLLGFSNRKTLLGLQIREDPSRHLAQSGILDLESKAIGNGAYDGELYWLALEDQSGIALDPRSLVIRQQTKFKSTPTAGPWRVGSAVYIELDATELSARNAKQFDKEKWTVSLGSSPLASAPFQLDEKHLFLCKNDGAYVVVDTDSGKKVTEGKLPAAISCPPIITSQTLHLGLKTGAIVSIALDDLLRKKE